MLIATVWPVQVHIHMNSYTGIQNIQLWTRYSATFMSFCRAVRLLKEELQLLQEQGSHVGEVVKAMDKKKVLVKVRVQTLAAELRLVECVLRSNFTSPPPLPPSLPPSLCRPGAS